MTDNTPETTTETPDAPNAEGHAPTATPEVSDDHNDDTPSPNREAAKYRTKLRDAEAERDALAERLAAAQRQNVTTTVAQRFRDAEDFWSTTELADVLGEDGNVSVELLTAAMDSALAAKPHWARPAPATESTSTVTSRDRVGGGKTPSWSDLLQGKLR